MSATLIDGKALAEEIIRDCSKRTATLVKQGITPCLAVIRVGEDPASIVYVNGKIADCLKAGMKSKLVLLDSNISCEALINTIEQCNQDSAIHGILLQLPLPKHLDEQLLINAIIPKKDADGFHPINAGRLLQGNINNAVVACTPAGIMKMLAKTNVVLSGKHAVVVGRSNIVGKPMAMLLLNANCTVTICHSKTHDIAKEVARADIVVAAVGKAELILGKWIKKGAVVIDVGMNRNARGKLVGDVAFNEAKQQAAWITPVPGGVGPMTRAMLLANTLTLAEQELAN